jgi:hypothetical protein
MDRLLTASADDSPPPDATTWFRQLTEVDYPAPASLEGLKPLSPNVWASFVTSESKVVGLPQFLSVVPTPEPPASYRVLGFHGRGLNRHAIYYTLQDGTNDVRLRLAFGGLFMIKAERREGVLADLRLVEWLAAHTRGLPVRCSVRFGVGDREIRLTTTGQRRKLYDCFHPRRGFPHEKVTGDLAKVLEALAREAAPAAP